MFQRLITAGERTDDIYSLLCYELCSPPPSIFDSSGLPLATNKAALADALWKSLLTPNRPPSDEVHYVLYVGALLHQVIWPKEATYDAVCDMYVAYVQEH